MFEQPVGGAQLQRAVTTLQPWAVLMHLGPRIDASTLQRTLQGIGVTKLLGGATLALHQAELHAFDLPDLFLFDTPQAALRVLQGNVRQPVETSAPCN